MSVAKINWAVHWRRYGGFIVHTPRRSFYLKPAEEPEYFSERYRIKTRVFYLPLGWRFVVKTRD